MTATRTLAVLLFGTRIGEASQAASGRFAFHYDQAWIQQGPGIPLSVSMPLSRERHEHAAVAPFLWGLLPDGEEACRAIARNAAVPVSHRSPLALLEVTGEDCAGAVQFVRPDRVGHLGEEAVEWLDEAGVADALRRAKRGLPPKGRGDEGRFSLAGAQPKTALHRGEGPAGPLWGIPGGRTPTTHILKPPIPGLAGQVENEHFCLRLAAALGLPAARSEVLAFGGETAIVVERYDRVRVAGGRTLRVHQEDMCQATATLPANKYQRDGGPGIARVVADVLRGSAAPRDEVEEDVAQFLAAVAFNWLIVGTDAHAKNFSILHGRAGRYRLAPLYDLNSALPYYDVRRVTMSLKVAGHYDFTLMPRHWERLAKECRFGADRLVAAVRDLIVRTPDLASDLAVRCRSDGIKHEMVPRLAAGIAERCRALAAAYSP